MAVVVIGGHTRNIGKTSVVAGLIAALPERRWVAVKITQFGHGVCSANGEPCDCETADHTIAISEERERESGTDSSRYLAAGAARAFWVRTRQGQLQEAMPRVRRLIADAAEAGSDVILESNSVLRFLRPDVFVSVVDASVADFKPSALRYLDRADALVLTGGELDHAAWSGVAASLLRTTVVRVQPPAYVSAELVELVRAKLPVLVPASH
jgi:molybdopterin-guanine dinucleotide biosynthesis protein